MIQDALACIASILVFSMLVFHAKHNKTVSVIDCIFYFLLATIPGLIHNLMFKKILFIVILLTTMIIINVSSIADVRKKTHDHKLKSICIISIFNIGFICLLYYKFIH